MKFDDETLINRKLVWLAFSDRFLDNELQEHDLSFIAKEMKDSAF